MLEMGEGTVTDDGVPSGVFSFEGALGEGERGMGPGLVPAGGI